MPKNKLTISLTLDRVLIDWLSDAEKTSQLANSVLRKHYDRYVVGVFNDKEDVEQTIEETTDEITKHESILNRHKTNLVTYKKLLKQMVVSNEQLQE